MTNTDKRKPYGSHQVNSTKTKQFNVV